MRPHLMFCVLALCVFFAQPAPARSTDGGLKVFISVDMEGVTGVVDPDDVSRTGKDYDYFREIMTREVNAAIEGAEAAGATEILVRDGHGTALNLLPEMLDRRARFVRGWSGGPLSMMEGIDATFDAVVFIGYHAKAGTADGVLAHTNSNDVEDLSVDGVSLPEAGLNALTAGYYKVPVVFLSGDKTICEQARNLLAPIETVAVKEGIGSAAISLQPAVARDRIKAGVESALHNLKAFKPYRLAAPYTLVLRLHKEPMVWQGALYPGVRRTGNWELTYVAKDVPDLLLAYQRMRMK